MVTPNSATQQHLPSFPESGAMIRLLDGQWAVAWGTPEWSATPPPQPYFYAPDFLLKNSHPFLSFPYWAQVETSVLQAQWGTFEKVQRNWHWEEPSYLAFAEVFAQIREQIQKGPLKKAVPVVFAQAAIPEEPNWYHPIVSRLCYLGAPFFAYGFWTPQRGLIGATPELLFHRNLLHRRLSTMALAGTWSQAQGSDADFLSDTKELDEHQWVIQFLHERLAQFGQCVQHPTEVLDLGSLRHLMTRIDVKEELEERSFVQWVKWLHPTPALGVYPLGHAPHGFYEAPFRDHFGAPFAFVDPNHFEHCLVGIRNIQWNKNSVRLGSGCGIVAQSDVEQEWAELACKRKSVREILCL